MAKIELSQLVSEMTPEQKIFLQSFYASFDNRSGANKRITNITPLYHCGIVAGTPFLVYDAAILYIGLSVSIGFTGVPAAGVTGTIFYNEANSANFNLRILSLYYDGANFFNGHSTGTINNIYFSRIVTEGLYMLFSGYRVNLV